MVACHAKRARPTGVPAAKLEIVAIDDSVDPFASGSVSPPSDVTIESEIVSLGGGSREEHFARTVVRAGERDAAARARLGAWLATVTLPAGARFGVGVVHDGPASAFARSCVLGGPVVVTSSDVVDAQATRDGSDTDPAVVITLASGGARRFEDFTRAWLGRRAAIVVDDDVMTMPVIRTTIAGGRLSITTGREDPDVADRLAASLRPTR